MINLQTEIALNRFGFGAKLGDDYKTIADNPEQWLFKQIAPLTFAAKTPTSKDIFDLGIQFSNAKKAESQDASMVMDKKQLSSQDIRKKIRRAGIDTAMSTLQEAIHTDNPFQYRLLDFFSNHFSVSTTGNPMIGLAPTLEREAIAPHLAGSFADMLVAVEQHPAMLVYLNNDVSIGPDSDIGKKRQEKGLNENLGREILELHTLGVNGGYTQKDVEELAMAITGWTVNKKQKGFQFRTKTHQPGTRTVLKKDYKDSGKNQGESILKALAIHPSTARYLSFKLIRHFVSDIPDLKFVDSLQKVWLDTEGDLSSVISALVKHPNSWLSDKNKYKTPREFIISSNRVLGGKLSTKELLTSLTTLGQQPFNAGSPAGYGDTSNDWDGAEALMSRIEWSNQYSARCRHSAIDIAYNSIGQQLSKKTLFMLKGAESNQQGLTLLLLSPEFQRR